jgi:hypothetical protein
VAPQDPSHDRASRRYEPNRLPVRAIGIGVVLFVAFAAVSHVLLWLLVKADARPRAVDRPASVVQGDVPPADAPRLQPSPGHDRAARADLRAMREAEDAVFRDMGWRRDLDTGRMRPPEELVRRLTAGPSRGASQTRPAGQSPAD